MFGFEISLLESLAKNSHKIKEYVEKNPEGIIEVKSDDIIKEPRFNFPFGPMISEEAKRQAFNTVWDNCDKDFHKQFPDDLSVLIHVQKERKVGDIYTPTAIKNAIKDVLGVNEEEAIRMFEMGPTRRMNR